MSDYWQSASSRYFDLDGELKITVLHPFILDTIGSVEGKVILDFGCGEGGLSSLLAKGGATVIAIDKSKTTIHRAKTKYSNINNLHFVHVNPPDYSEIYKYEPYDFAILSLVLVTIPDDKSASGVFEAISRTLSKTGRVIIGDSHPCFRDQSFSTFKMQLSQYNTNCIPYKVEVTDGYSPEHKVTFQDYHRSLSTMSTILTKHNFLIRRLLEAYDTNEVPGLSLETKLKVNKIVPPFLIIEAILA